MPRKYFLLDVVKNIYFFLATRLFSSKKYFLTARKKIIARRIKKIRAARKSIVLSLYQDIIFLALENIFVFALVLLAEERKRKIRSKEFYRL